MHKELQMPTWKDHRRALLHGQRMADPVVTVRPATWTSGATLTHLSSPPCLGAGLASLWSLSSHALCPSSRGQLPVAFLLCQPSQKLWRLRAFGGHVLSPLPLDR